MTISQFSRSKKDYSGSTEQFKTARTRSQGGDNNLKIMQKRHKKSPKSCDFRLKMAEGVRFELTRRCRQTVFKTASL